jgi:hypothetical protein
MFFAFRCWFLAELFQNLFAVRVLFQQRQAAADFRVQADRFAENDQVDPVDDHDDRDEDHEID